MMQKPTRLMIDLGYVFPAFGRVSHQEISPDGHAYPVVLKNATPLRWDQVLLLSKILELLSLYDES